MKSAIWLPLFNDLAGAAGWHGWFAVVGVIKDGPVSSGF
jgi:hypothetical protein